MDNSYFRNKITFLNAFATILIVILHAKTPERYGQELNINTYPFIYCVWLFTSIGVPTFFFISALLFYRSCKLRDIPTKLKSRIKTLVIPYLIWNTLFVLIFYALYHCSFFHDRMNTNEGLNSWKEIFHSIIHARYTVLWFVKDLIIFNILSPVIFFIIKNLKLSIVCILISFIISIQGKYGGYEHILTWLPIYLSGAVMGYHFSGEKQNGTYFNWKEKIRHRTSTKILLLSIFLVSYFAVIINEQNITYYRFVSPIILWILIDLCFEDYLNFKFKKKKWMSYAFFIYCTHHFILNVLQKLIVLTCPHNQFVINFTFITTPIITIAIIILIADKISDTRIYSIMCGGRK